MQSLSCGTRTLTACDLSRAAESAARGLSLGEEDHRVVAFGAAGLLVELVEPEVVLAVLELRHAHAHGLRPLARLLLDGVELAAELRSLLDLRDELVRLGRRAVEHLERGLLDVRHEVGAYLRVAELRLRLAREVRVLHADRDRADDSLADVVAVELRLRRVLVERLREALLERGEVRAALRRVLAVDERVVLLREAVGVREHELKRLGAVVERRVELLELRLVGDQVRKPVLRHDPLPVQDEREARVEVRVHLEAAHHVLLAEAELLEYRRVRQEAHERAAALSRVLELAALLGYELALLERRLGELAVARGADVELVRKRVHRLGADAVHAHRELERVRVELAARVELRHAVDDLAERYATPVVAHRAAPRVPVELDLDPLALAHDELVDRVVDHFLHQDVNAVVVVASVRSPAYVHSEPQPDVLHRAQVLYLLFAVFLRHLSSFSKIGAPIIS